MTSVPHSCYLDRVPVPLADVPVAAPVDHTMALDLDDYVAQRLPATALRDALRQHRPVEIHGVHPDHLPEMAAASGWRDVEQIGSTTRAGKALNSVRPVLHRGVNPFGSVRLLLAVTPGRDYVMHYAGLVRHLVRQETVHVDELLEVWRYPDAEARIADWTGLDHTVTGGADTVVLGRVEQVAQALTRHGCDGGRRRTFPHYTTWTFAAGDRTVCLLGVHFSYWGCIGGRLAVRCADLGASEILYVGKLGALTSPSEIYDRLFVPSRYAILSEAAVRTVGDGPPNGLLDHDPELDSGLHVSVPTVLEEDHRQRRVASALGAATLDNELAQMALALEGSPVRFSALHYATDYLRHPEEVTRPVAHSLARGRSTEARRSQHATEALVGDRVAEYLTATSPARRAPAALAGGR